MHDQTALRTEGIDDLLGQFPDVAGEFDSGYRGLRNDHPEQVNVPPKKPAKDAGQRRTPRRVRRMGAARRAGGVLGRDRPRHRNPRPAAAENPRIG
jgi:hypothetical protein